MPYPVWACEAALMNIGLNSSSVMRMASEELSKAMRMRRSSSSIRLRSVISVTTATTPISSPCAPRIWSSRISTGISWPPAPRTVVSP